MAQVGAMQVRTAEISKRVANTEADYHLALKHQHQRKSTSYQRKMKAARTDFDAFMEFCFEDLETKKPIKQGAIHREWTQHINNHSRALILAPREHGKTEQIPIGRVLFWLGQNPQLRIKIICQDDGSAMKRLGSVKQHIERSARLHEVFPDLRKHRTHDDWSKHTLTVDREGADKDPSVEACGVLSTGTGGRCDRMIFDDIVDFRNAIAQPALRDMVKEVFENVWINLLTQNAKAVYIATPWHEDDQTAKLKMNSEWALLEQPVAEDLIPIWPEQWSRERLTQRSAEIGSRAFGRGFHLVAITGEDQLFSAIENCVHPEFSMHDIDPSWPRYTGIDLGHSKRKQSGGKLSRTRPFTVIFTFALDPDKRRWPCDIRRGHWSGPETARQIIQVHEDLDPNMIVVENNAYQDTILDWIREVSPDKSIRLKPFTTGKNKADEQIGLPSLASEFDNRSWVIATDGHEADNMREVNETWAAWYAEMKFYPAMQLSDTVMACWLAREGSRRTLKAAMVSDEEESPEDHDWRVYDARASFQDSQSSQNGHNGHNGR